MKPFVFWMIRPKEPSPELLGRIHAEMVTAERLFNVPLAGTVTASFEPSKLSAPPDWPVVRVGPFTRVPVLPLSEESVAVVPLASSYRCKSTGPLALEVLAVASLDQAELPLPFSARTR